MFKKVDQFAQISHLKNVKTLQYLYESLHTRSFKQLLDKAIAYIKIYSSQTITFFIEKAVKACVRCI